MDKRLFLLDAMALIFRAYYALISSPRITIKGRNTNAQFGFTNALIDLINNQQPSHMAVCFDTHAPTERHTDFADYKANRQEAPEDLLSAVPDIKAIIKGFNIPCVELDGFEADDVIGTLSQQAAAAGYEVYMVTPDKDYGQLVSDRIKIYKPGYQGGSVEIMVVNLETQKSWSVATMPVQATVAPRITNDGMNVGYTVSEPMPARGITYVVPATGGVLIQFPFYAVIFGMIVGTGISTWLAELFTRITTHGTYPVLVALYSAILGTFVPSGGSKWVIEAPYILEAANLHHVHLGWVVQIYNAAEALPNLVNPFWMLPLLGLLKLKARDLVGYTVLQMLLHIPIVFFLCWWFARTIPYVPPMR